MLFLGGERSLLTAVFNSLTQEGEHTKLGEGSWHGSNEGVPMKW